MTDHLESETGKSAQVDAPSPVQAGASSQQSGTSNPQHPAEPSHAHSETFSLQAGTSDPQTDPRPDQSKTSNQQAVTSEHSAESTSALSETSNQQAATIEHLAESTSTLSEASNPQAVTTEHSAESKSATSETSNPQAGTIEHLAESTSAVSETSNPQAVTTEHSAESKSAKSETSNPQAGTIEHLAESTSAVSETSNPQAATTVHLAESTSALSEMSDRQAGTAEPIPAQSETCNQGTSTNDLHFPSEPSPVQSETSNQQAETCRHMTSPEANSRLNRDRKVCPFNLAGTCRHGDECWYGHSRRHTETMTDSAVTGHSTAMCPRHQIPLPEPTDPTPPNSPPRPTMDPSKWIEAPEFVPHFWRALAESLKSEMEGPVPCPNVVLHGRCPFSSSACPYLHGDTCELCQVPCLDPEDEEQRREHMEKCVKELETDMENSFAIERSAKKACDVCHDVVWDKELASERKFGILEKCNHVFCLGCIRRWRQRRRSSSGEPDDAAIQECQTFRQCPVCRIHSDFFVPSSVWVEGAEEKANIIREFKEAVGKKPCRYFKVGSICPLGETCFYLHSEAIRKLIEQAPPPPPRPRRRRRDVASGPDDLVDAMLLWEYLAIPRDDDDPNYQEILADMRRMDAVDDDPYHPSIGDEQRHDINLQRLDAADPSIAHHLSQSHDIVDDLQRQTDSGDPHYQYATDDDPLLDDRDIGDDDPHRL